MHGFSSTRRWFSYSWPAFAVLVAPYASIAETGSLGKNKAVVSLVSSVETIVPGSTVDLAIAFKITPEWHIYWHDSGDAGFPPSVQWTLPAGFKAGDLRFPVPRRHKDAGGLITNILEEEPVLLVSLTTPETTKESKAVISAKVVYLVCKEQCLREMADLRIELPVAPAQTESKVANQELFDRARRAMPLASSKYLTITPSAPTETLSPTKPFDLNLAIELKPGFHIQSNKPLSPAFFATDVFVERTAGIMAKSPRFPPDAKRKLPGLGDVSEYIGKINIVVPCEVDGEPPAGPATIRGILAYQACNEKGTCFPPEATEFSHVVNLAALVKTGDAAGIRDARTADATDGATPSDSGRPDPRSPEWKSAAEDTELSSSSKGPWVPTTLLGALFGAFLGGLILNIMPCVLPVISIKVLSFVQQSKEDPKRVVGLGLTFVAGILVSFWLLAVGAIILKSLDKSVAWGSQFQSPTFTIVMISLIFVFGLSLFGVFLINLPGAAASQLSTLESREGYFGAFMKGVLGTILATPCTAPLLGPALGFASNTTNSQLFAILTAVGFGMASPFIILAFKPGWLKFLPRPGLWMEHFKQFMGFILMGTDIWLLITLGELIGSAGVAWTMAFLAFLGVACWLIGKQTPLTSPEKRLAGWASSLAVVLFGGWFCYGYAFQIKEGQAQVARINLALRSLEIADLEREGGARLAGLDFQERIPWQAWTRGRAEELASKGYTVYVDYTATWCLTCQTNKKVVLESDEVRRRMDDLNIVPLKADFTSFDADIFDDLTRFGRAGVPLNVIYPACDPEHPILLPELLLPGLVLEKLNAAGASACGATTCSCEKVAAAAP